MRPWLALVAATLTGPAFAQVNLTGPDQFPQFRGPSSLPGSGFPLRPDNKIGAPGALALSTPVGYSLGHWEGFVGLSFLSTDGRFPVYSGSGDFINGNGTFWQMVGIKAGDSGYLTVSNVIVSRIGDNTTSYHFRPETNTGNWGFAIGVQDISGEIGSAGDTFPAVDGRSSRSVYVVVTSQVGPSTFASVGVGTRRFRYGFANASHWFNDKIGLFAEWDGYNSNVGGTYMLGDMGFSAFGKRANGIMTLGIVRGEYPFWMVGVSF